MHVLAGALGEMSAAEIPLSASFSEDDRANLLKGDDDPMEVVIEVAPGKSTRGWHYTPAALQKMVSHVQEKTLAGIKGHQKDEEVANQFVDPATHWIGATWQNEHRELTNREATWCGLVHEQRPAAVTTKKSRGTACTSARDPSRSCSRGGRCRVPDRLSLVPTQDAGSCGPEPVHVAPGLPRDHS
jgi:hypothetical protein